MRATTADGHTLRVPDARLGTLLPQLSRSGLGGLVRRHYSGDLDRARPGNRLTNERELEAMLGGV